MARSGSRPHIHNTLARYRSAPCHTGDTGPVSFGCRKWHRGRSEHTHWMAVKSRFLKCIGRYSRIGALALFLVAWPVGQAAADDSPLRILLTNDDGYDAPGLGILRDTLVAAGH